MQISAARFALFISATIDDPLIHARMNSLFGRVTFQRARLILFVATVLTALETLSADAQINQDLTNNAAQVEIVCGSLSGVDGDARVQVDELQLTLYDFYAIFGAQTCTQVLEALRETVAKTQGQVDTEAEQ